MQPSKRRGLLEECLALAQCRRPPVTDDETLIPVAEYLDPRRFIHERERWFAPVPNLVAHGSELREPGDFITRTVLDVPALVVRGEDGRVRAFANVCRHRGATLELRDAGHCRRFVCPYHAWSYTTDGQLASVRHPDGFPTLDREATRLAELPCVEAGGFVWVVPRVASPPDESFLPDASTASLFEELEGLGCGEGVVFGRSQRRWRANWKLIVDGGLEAYHFKVAHRDTIAEFFTDTLSVFEMLGDHVRSVLPRTSILELAEQPHEEWDLRRHTHLVYSLRPNASVLMQEQHFELILMTPVSVDETDVEILSIVPDPAGARDPDKARTYWTKNQAFTRRTLDEDFLLAEQIQRGMASGANQSFRFAGFEGALTRWHRRLDAAVSAPPVEG